MCIAIAAAAEVVWVKQELARMVQPDMLGAQSVTGRNTSHTREGERARSRAADSNMSYPIYRTKTLVAAITWLNLGQRSLHCPHRTAHRTTLVTFADNFSPGLATVFHQPTTAATTNLRISPNRRQATGDMALVHASPYPSSGLDCRSKPVPSEFLQQTFSGLPSLA